MPARITFRGVLFFTAALYLGGFVLTGGLLTQLPTSWFTAWLGSIFALMDKAGFFNVWSGMTPGVHYLYFLLWKPAQAISGGQWDLALIFSVLWYFLNMVALFTGAYLFYKIAEHLLGETKALLLGTVYLVLFLTFEWYTVIDPIAIAALLGAIFCSMRGWGKAGGLLLAVSTVVKPLGVFILPVVIRSEFMSRKAKISFVATFLASTAAMLLPFAAGNFKIFMSSFHWQSGRAPWETVYALFMWLLKKPVPSDPFFQDYSGVVARDWGWGGITPVPSMMTTPVPGYSPWYNEVSLLLLAMALLAFLLFKKVATKTQMLWGCLFALGAYFAFFYGWSTQFFFWLAPFMLICLPLGITALFRIIALLEYPVFYGLYLARVASDLVTSVAGMPVSWTMSLAPAGPAGYWSLIMLRTIFLLALGIVSWRRLPGELWQPILAIFRFRFNRGFTGSDMVAFQAENNSQIDPKQL